MSPPRLLHDLLDATATCRPAAVALIHAEERATYAELADAAGRVAGWLRACGLGPGERVALLQTDPISYVASYFGTLRAGGIVVPLLTHTSARSLARQVNDCDAALLFTERRLLRHVRDADLPSLRAVVVAESRDVDTEGIPDVVDLDGVLGSPVGEAAACSPTDPAVILYTSGTTGEPKGVTLSHANLLANTCSIVQYLGLTHRDRIMDVLPLCYSYGNSLLLTHVAVGGSLVVNHNFLYPNVILAEMARHRVTGFAGVPSTFAILLHRSALAGSELPDLRYVTQAGGPMPPSLVDRLLATLPDVNVYLMYGQTEASARLTYLPPEDVRRKPGSVGKAIPGVSIEVIGESGKVVPPGEVGELVATGGNVMLGYWGRPETTGEVLREGRLHTGDLARTDEEGYLYLVGRRHEMIKTAAHRVAPREIEEVLLEHPAVREAAVIGAPDELLGESIEACVVLAEDSIASARDLGEHCRASLPVHMIPRHIWLMDDLPKTASGKIVKEKLKSDLCAAAACPAPGQQAGGERGARDRRKRPPGRTSPGSSSTRVAPINAPRRSAR